MKVLMQNRLDLYEKGGGDFIQMKKTQESLSKLGVEVDISCDLEPNLAKYDLVHLYNVTRVHETYVQFRNAKRQGKKVVISPIYHRLQEIYNFQKKGQWGLFKTLGIFFPGFYTQEFIKNSLRFILDKKQRKAIWTQFRKGFRKEQKEVLQDVDAWILLAEEEGETIQKELGVQNRFFIVPNGIDIVGFPKKISKSKKIPFQDFVLSVGRIEPRKNQISLIKAMQNLNLNLVFIGEVNPNYNHSFNNSYFKEFQSLVNKNDWIFWKGKVPHKEIMDYYGLAKVHVNPSWFEVVSLVNLEAAAAGCNLVLSDVGYQKAYFHKFAHYCNPENTESIQRAVQEAYMAKKSDKLQKYVSQNFTWERCAKKSLEVYNAVLKGN